jgi:BMFP domain-containing protein YqiC
MMIDLRIVDELTRKLTDSLPPGISQAKDDMENRFRSVLTGAFERMNLVGREEYDAQCTILDETRAKLATLESRLDELSAEP